MSDPTEPKQPDAQLEPSGAATAEDVSAPAEAADPPASESAGAPGAAAADAPGAATQAAAGSAAAAGADVPGASASAAPAPVEVVAEPAAPPSQAELEHLRHRPTYVFFGVLAALSLLADIATKAWAEVVLSKRTALDPSITVIKDHLSFTLAYNRGGAWGLLHDASENVRRPFFLLVSVLAIAFIVSLYSRLAPTQRALKWGLPLVLGGALGNLSDRITRSSVIDFIDYRADWIEKMNQFIAKYSKGWAVTDHWPTFNVADVFICIGVALMAVDMMTSRRKPAESSSAVPLAAPAGSSAAPVVGAGSAAPPVGVGAGAAASVSELGAGAAASVGELGAGAAASEDPSTASASSSVEPGAAPAADPVGAAPGDSPKTDPVAS